MGLLLLAIAAAVASGRGSAKPNASAAALRRAEAAYWQFVQREGLLLRVRLGLPVEALPDLSIEKSERDASFGRSLSATLDGVRPGDLSHEEELSVEILRREAREPPAGPAHYWLHLPATPDKFPCLRR